MSAVELIVKRIMSEGAISFRDFMDTALYTPGAGYYTSAKENFGKQGDYYTSPYLGSLFGDMIAKQIEEMWVLLGKKKFTVVEYGAGMGFLCRQIMSRLELNPELFEQFNYSIIEKNASMHPGKKNTGREKVRWYESVNEIPEVVGCILSNELIDNFPIHRVVMQDQLMEIFVDYKNGFQEVLRPARPELVTYLNDFGVSLPL
jgi:SAM-dependent MidA family methyltransferase